MSANTQSPKSVKKRNKSLNLHISRKHFGLLARLRNLSSSSSFFSESENVEKEVSSPFNSRKSSTNSACSRHRQFRTSSSSSCDSGVFEDYRVIFLGASKVGKTSLITQYLHNQFASAHHPTVQEMYGGEIYFGSSQVTLAIEDTGDNYIQEFPAMADISLNRADVAALVFSVDDPDTFEEVAKIRDFISDKYPSLPLVIVGNKTDLERRLPFHEIEATVTLDWECAYAECSAKDNKELEEVFRELVKQEKTTSSNSVSVTKHRP